MPIHVNYDAEELAPFAPGLSVIVVRDRSRELGGMTVTNAADAVIAELVRKYGVAGKLRARVIYRDSDAWWDELEHDGERFIGFNVLGQRKLEDAIEDLQQGHLTARLKP
jgi:hypothetical protein